MKVLGGSKQQTDNTHYLCFRRATLLKTQSRKLRVERDSTHDATAKNQVLTYDGLDLRSSIGGGDK